MNSLFEAFLGAIYVVVFVTLVGSGIIQGWVFGPVGAALGGWLGWWAANLVIAMINGLIAPVIEYMERK